MNLLRLEATSSVFGEGGDHVAAVEFGDEFISVFDDRESEFEAAVEVGCDGFTDAHCDFSERTHGHDVIFTWHLRPTVGIKSLGNWLSETSKVRTVGDDNSFDEFTKSIKEFMVVINISSCNCTILMISIFIIIVITIVVVSSSCIIIRSIFPTFEFNIHITRGFSSQELDDTFSDNDTINEGMNGNRTKFLNHSNKTSTSSSNNCSLWFFSKHVENTVSDEFVQIVAHFGRKGVTRRSL